MVYFFLVFFYGKFLFYSCNQTVSIFYIQILYLALIFPLAQMHICMKNTQEQRQYNDERLLTSTHT